MAFLRICLPFPTQAHQNTGGKKGHEDKVANAYFQLQSEEPEHMVLDQWVEGDACGRLEAWALDKAQLSEVPGKEEKPGGFIVSKNVVFKTIFVSISVGRYPQD